MSDKVDILFTKSSMAVIIREEADPWTSRNRRT